VPLLTRLALGGLLLSAVAHAALFPRPDGSPSERSPAISLRKRVHVNTLITQPGTMDIEWGGSFSANGGFTFPMTIHFTPEGRHIWWGRTEFSVSFDSLSHDSATHFGDRATVAATCVIKDGDKLDIAVAPTATILLRGDSGMRAGATGIARYDAGRSSAGVTFTWTGATHPSPTNPAGVFDIGAGYGFRLKPNGPLGHLTPHMNWLYEKSTGIGRQLSLFEGIEYQVTDPFAIDFAVQHISLWGNQPDTQLVVGVTVNTGRLRRH
jgi:hypothetical protein